MKIKLNLQNFLFSFILFYHVIYLFFGIFLPEMNNKIVIGFMVLVYIYLVTYVLKRKIAAVISISLVIAFYSVYILNFFGFGQLVHTDFYSFVLLFLLFIAYSDKNVLCNFKKFFSDNHINYIYSVYIFYFLLIFSMIFSNGLHLGYGSSIPVLYGPYSISHILAYSLIGIYCGLGVLYKIQKTRKIAILKIISVICIVWTATRSGVLAICVIILADYLSIKSVNKKLLIFILFTIFGVYVVFFTDLLQNNPLIQKTIWAVQHGSITNGRELFVNISLDYYRRLPSNMYKIFGVSIGSLRDVMLHDTRIGVSIHAHNDYINALVGYGAVGLILLILSQLKLFFICKKKILAILLELFIFMLCYYNGLAMYTCLTPVLLMVFLFFVVSDEQKNTVESAG